MISSEGIPGLARDRVQVSELFYHQPYFDILNRKFSGFTEVERITYGDEFMEDGSTSQKSSYTNELYYTQASDVAGLHLSGKSKVLKTYSLVPENEQVRMAQETDTMDPAEVTQHSLSSYTKGQGIPVPGALLACVSTQWDAVEDEADVFYIRRVHEQEVKSAGAVHQQSIDDEVCQAPTSTVVYEDYDDFNLPNRVVTTIKELSGPLNIRVPAVTQAIDVEYEPSRTNLSELGIVNAPSRQVRSSADNTMQDQRSTYHSDNGKLAQQDTVTFSMLDDIPADLVDFHQSAHTVTRILDYDRFGNITTVTDAVGQTESVVYDASGVFPVTYTKLHGDNPDLDQVTVMTYEGERKGLLATNTTPVGMTTQYRYDSLGRRVQELNDDGAETTYQYRIGTDNKPTIILTSTKRYPAEADVQEGETQWIHFGCGV